MLAAIAITALAQIRISSVFAKYSKIMSSSGISAATVARGILDRSGLGNIRIEKVAGNLTDHYDPRSKVLRLSEKVCDSSSVAAIGVASHEAGHAIQDSEEYYPLKIRGLLVPVTNFASKASWLLIIVGLLLSLTNLISVGIICFSLVVVFQLITLPVEFNASSRALALLEDGGYLLREEVAQSRKVLNAAALTYVAAALASILQLVRLFLIFGRRN
jgi:Zn-dependent membrane protease YugP